MVEYEIYLSFIASYFNYVISFISYFVYSHKGNLDRSLFNQLRDDLTHPVTLVQNEQMIDLMSWIYICLRLTIST